MSQKLKKNVVTARCAIQNDHGDLLFLRRESKAKHNPDKLEFPGGKAEDMPDDLKELFDAGPVIMRMPGQLRQALGEAAMTESKQESGYEVKLTSGPVPVVRRIMTDPERAGTGYAMYCFRAEKTGGKLVLSDEHTSALWLPYDEAMERQDVALETRVAAHMFVNLGLL